MRGSLAVFSHVVSLGNGAEVVEHLERAFGPRVVDVFDGVAEDSGSVVSRLAHDRTEHGSPGRGWGPGSGNDGDVVLFVRREAANEPLPKPLDGMLTWPATLETALVATYGNLSFVLLYLDDDHRAASVLSARTVRLGLDGAGEAAWSRVWASVDELIQAAGFVSTSDRPQLRSDALSPLARGVQAVAAGSALAPTIDHTRWPRPFHKIVSLGGGSQAVFHVHRCFPDQREMRPFDWLLTPEQAIVDLFRRDFSGVLLPENLVDTGSDQTHRHVRDRGYEIMLLKDFSLAPIEEAQPAIKAKYDRLFDEFRALLSSGQRILFIRQDPDSRNRLEESRERHSQFAPYLAEVIEQTYPSLDFALLSLSTGRLKLKHEDDRLIMWDLPQGIQWFGDSDAWDNIFARIDVVAP